MELQIKDFHDPDKVSWNYEELKSELQAKVGYYNNLAYTEDQLQEAKIDRANLNKLAQALDTKRKEIKRRYLAPYNEFEAQIKDLIAVVNEPIGIIDKQLKTAEEKRAAEKQTEIDKLFESKNFPEWVNKKSIIDPKWLNKSFSDKKVDAALSEALNRINSDIQTIQMLPDFSFEAMEAYKTSLDLNRAIQEAKRMAEIQKRKHEAEAAANEDSLSRTAAASNLNDIYDATPKKTSEIDIGAEEQQVTRSWVGFEACLSKDEAKDLGAWFAQHGIKIRRPQK